MSIDNNYTYTGVFYDFPIDPVVFEIIDRGWRQGMDLTGHSICLVQSIK